MDPQRFDALVQALGAATSRRRTLGALLSGLVAPLLPGLTGEAKRKKGNGRGKGKGKHKGGGNGRDRDKQRGKRVGAEKAHGKSKKRKKQPPKPPSDEGAGAGGPCREEGHPCEGNQRCCEGLVCTVSGPGAAERCTRCPEGQIACANECIDACTASDQCHVAGECDPDTGECTNPRAENGTRCDDGDPCTDDDVCRNGECRGTPKDCSEEEDACNDGVCRGSDGACVKRPKRDGTSCNADNDSCTAGDSCQNGICTPGAGVDCSELDDDCNTGVCDPSTGECVKEPKEDGTGCNDGDPCTRGDTCQGGTCQAGPPRSCPVCQACSGGDCQPVDSDDRCATVCCNGICCSSGTACDGNNCPTTCLATNEVCDEANDQCCDTCARFAACARPGETGRCCRGEDQDCEGDCDCCDGVCADGTCCNPNNRQCQITSDCCPGQTCDTANQICVATCGRQNAICGEFPCCPGFKCVRGECWPEICQAPTEQCNNSNQCCPDGLMDCRTTFESSGQNVCCRPFGQTCDSTAECCDITVCGPQSKCCIGSFFDPDRGGARGCIGREDDCCPGRRCNPFSNACCLEEGQPVNPDTVVDCCHFTQENGVCVCHSNGQACAAPSGPSGPSSCCDGLICFDGRCEPPCLFPASPCGPGSLPCCGGLICRNGFCQT